MQKPPPHLNTLWEYLEDPNQIGLLRQALMLILNAPADLSTEAGFDKEALMGLNEDVPVEDANPTQLKQ